MSNEYPESKREQFERLLGLLHGLPDVRETKPNTVMDTLPMIGTTTTAVIQTMRSEEYGFLVFLQVVRGDETVRLVLPDAVAQVIYRQRARLVDRSTPESRARAKAKRDRERKRAEKAERSAEWRRKHPGQKVGAK